jgi:beta-phosphoglucomutase-like phosphatase (HAD superfamily)
MLMDAFEAEHGVALERGEVVQIMRGVFAEGIDQLHEIEAVASIARRNHGRLPMAVASGGTMEIVAATLRATNLLPLFDTVVTLDEVKRAKPEPDLFLEAARRLGVDPGHCLVFEDSREGLEAAQRAGMPAVDIVEVLRL